MADTGVTAALLLSCPDQQGLVATVADFLYRHHGNIIHADQHTDDEEGVFLQRVEWELDGFGLAREEIGQEFHRIAERFEMTWSLRFSDHVPRIALFVSKLPHCLYDLLGRWKMGEFLAEIPVVISNHDELRSVAADFGVTYEHIDVEAGAADQRILELLRRERIDVVALARYMQFVGPELVEAYRNRMINIHHSFLPAFAGGRPYHQAHERGVKIIGATAHYVTEKLDQGPIIEQDVARVSHRDSVGDLVRKGRDLEKVVLARAVDLHLRNRVVVYGNKTVVFD